MTPQQETAGADIRDVPLAHLVYKIDYPPMHERYTRYERELVDAANREVLRTGGCYDVQIVGVYESLRDEGQLNPCLVTPTAIGGVFSMWLGNQRLAAARALKWATLSCVVVWDGREGITAAKLRHYGQPMRWNYRTQEWDRG